MIYLVKAEETNLYKIGYTGGKVKNRVKAMQTGCPHKLSIIRECLGGQEREQMLHKAFSENRKQGEYNETEELLESFKPKKRRIIWKVKTLKIYKIWTN